MTWLICVITFNTSWILSIPCFWWCTCSWAGPFFEVSRTTTEGSYGTCYVPTSVGTNMYSKYAVTYVVIWQAQVWTCCYKEHIYINENVSNYRAGYFAVTKYTCKNVLMIFYMFTFFYISHYLQMDKLLEQNMSKMSFHMMDNQ